MTILNRKAKTYYFPIAQGALEKEIIPSMHFMFSDTIEKVISFCCYFRKTKGMHNEAIYHFVPPLHPSPSALCAATSPEGRGKRSNAGSQEYRKCASAQGKGRYPKGSPGARSACRVCRRSSRVISERPQAALARQGRTSWMRSPRQARAPARDFCFFF